MSKILSVVVPRGQRTHVRLLNDRALGGRVGERNAQLDEVRARVRHRVYDLLGDVQRRVTAGYKGNESCLSDFRLLQMAGSCYDR